ncbi:MAG TPA: hypothetical protein VFR01_06435 [Geobacterales bacterium]|nr:hypothetical protein [Geobacterales bacterium]
MTPVNGGIAFFIVLIAFALGYWLVSFLFNRLQRPRQDDPPHHTPKDLTLP